MSLLAFLLACGAGSVLGLAAAPSGQTRRLAGLAGLLIAFCSALLIGPNTSATIGEVSLAGSEYSGLFLACATGSALLLCVVTLISGGPDDLAPAALAAFAGLAVAITAADPVVALAGGAAAATTGALVIIRTTPRPVEADGRLAEIRTIAIIAACVLFAAIAVIRPPWTGPGDAPILALAFLGFGLAVAVRSGAVPFHVPAVRMRDTAVPLAPALLLVWVPAGLGLLAVSWSAITFGVRSDSMHGAMQIVQAVAVATLVLGALAALVHDELEEIAAYSIAADAGFVLLALASGTDAAAQPARLWLLVFVAAKTGLLAWAAAVSRTFGTSNLPRLRGWLRRTPLLGVALVVIAIATLGWPGGSVYEARSTLIRLALPGQLQFLFAASILLSVACYVRLMVFGVFSPTEEVIAARGELPGRPARHDETQLAPEAETGAVVAAMSAEPAVAAESDPAKSDPTPEAESAPIKPGRRAFASRINRTQATSLIVLGGTVLALTLAFGGLGAGHASQFGIPLDAAAHATPTPTPVPTAPPATSTPLPTRTPGPSGSSSLAPSSSGSATPTASPVPIKTSGPNRPDQN